MTHGGFSGLSARLVYVGLGAREAENPDASGHRRKSLQEALPFLGKGKEGRPCRMENVYTLLRPNTAGSTVGTL